MYLIHLPLFWTLSHTCLLVTWHYAIPHHFPDITKYPLISIIRKRLPQDDIPVWGSITSSDYFAFADRAYWKGQVHFEHQTLGTALESCTQKFLTCPGQCDLKLNEPRKMILFGIMHLLFYNFLFPFILSISRCSSSCCQCACFSRCALLLSQAGNSMKAGVIAVFITSVQMLHAISRMGLIDLFVFVVLNLIGLAKHERWDYCQ